MMFMREGIKSIELITPDILYTFTDPAATDTTRIWVVGKDSGSPMPYLEMKAIFHFDAAKINYLDMSNFNVHPDLPDSWSTVIAPEKSFEPNFPIPQIEKDEGNLKIKAYQLRLNTGKGPCVSFPDFQKPASHSVDVWKIMDQISRGS